MISFSGTWSDGEALRPVAVVVEVSSDAAVRVSGAGVDLQLPLADIRCSDRLAEVPRFLYLPGGGVIETTDNAAVDQALLHRRRTWPARLIHRLETWSTVAAIAALVIIALGFGALYFGLPALARHTAARTPPAIEQRAGRVALATFENYTAASGLSRAEKNRVRAQLARLLPDRPPEALPRLEFRSMGPGGANAFALPGDIIVVTDEFVQLATHDDEIAAVLAHELGHLELRHGIQSMLRNSFALLVVAAITGDLSTLTNFAGTIPFLILRNGYSREFEREADDYAHRLMSRRGIQHARFASILKKIDTGHGNPRKQPTYLSTHPNTEERIRMFQPAAPLQDTVPSPLPTEIPLQPDTLRLQSGLTGEMPAHIKSERAVYSFPKLDTQPALVHRTPPIYPFSMRAAGVPGEVVVDFVVDRNGDVRSAYAVQASHEAFIPAALASVATWKFTPGLHRGQPANARVMIPIHFTIEPDPPK